MKVIEQNLFSIDGKGLNLIFDVADEDPNHILLYIEQSSLDIYF